MSALLPLLLLLLSLILERPSWAIDGDVDGLSSRTGQHHGPRHVLGEVILSPEQQALAGLTIEPLPALAIPDETQSAGKVEDILPLLTLRSQMRAARAEFEIATAARALAEKNRERIKTLFQADIIAGRELLQMEAQWQADTSRLEAARLHLEDLRREADQQLGKALAEKVLEGPSTFLDQLTAHQKALIKITLPVGQSLSAGSKVVISRHQDQHDAIPATLLSPAPHTDDLVQGETFFFESPGTHLRAGMRVNAWIRGTSLRHGVALPAAAIVFYQGKAFVYLDQGEGHFRRVSVTPRPGRTRDERFETELTPGQPIVTLGAQTLLAEEFRPEIPEED